MLITFTVRPSLFIIIIIIIMIMIFLSFNVECVSWFWVGRYFEKKKKNSQGAWNPSIITVEPGNNNMAEMWVKIEKDTPPKPRWMEMLLQCLFFRLKLKESIKIKKVYSTSFFF